MVVQIIGRLVVRQAFRVGHVHLNSTTYTASGAATVVHYYRDIAIPAGANYVYLNYYLKYPTIDNTYDYFYVYRTTTGNTPVAGTVPGAGYTNLFTNTATTYAGYTAMPQVDLTALAGTTVRLVFTFKNDGASPYADPAVDNISLTYCNPTTSLSPTGDGGFETGTTFAANGWTAVNGGSDNWQRSHRPCKRNFLHCQCRLWFRNSRRRRILRV
ncbi:MAG: hypothetical protein HYY40_09610 [Bacteroidetes bacterium]|nr:hypothetical protein [Bacteroidota bacterium]